MPPSLVLLNTNQATTDDSKLAQTTFYFDSDEDPRLYLNLDEGGHEPSPEENSLAPFYHAASHRVLAIRFSRLRRVFAVKTEVILRLAQEREGTDLPWGQWKAHTVELGGSVPNWVSGPRLFSAGVVPRGLEVHDFSPRVSKRYTEHMTDADGIIRQVVQPCMRVHYLPWNSPAIYFSNGSYNSIVFIMVNAPL